MSDIVLNVSEKLAFQPNKAGNLAEEYLLSVHLEAGVKMALPMLDCVSDSKLLNVVLKL